MSNFWPEVERSGATIASILGSMGAMLVNAPDTEAGRRCKGQIHTVRGNPFTEEVKSIWRERFGAKGGRQRLYHRSGSDHFAGRWRVCRTRFVWKAHS